MNEPRHERIARQIRRLEKHLTELRAAYGEAWRSWVVDNDLLDHLLTIEDAAALVNLAPKTVKNHLAADPELRTAIQRDENGQIFLRYRHVKELLIGRIGASKRLGDAKRELMEVMIDQHKPVQEIAETLKISPRTVQRAAKARETTRASS